MSALPASLRELAEQTGAATVALLVAHFGGCRIRVPKTLPPRHRLLDALPDEAAHALVARFGGETLSIPRNAAGILALRNQGIRRDRADGMMIAAIARKHGLSERSIYNVLKVTP